MTNTITKDQAVQLAREAGFRLPEFYDNVDGDNYKTKRFAISQDLLNFIQATYKLGRNAGLDDASELCGTPKSNGEMRTAGECESAIESLKDNT